MLNPTKNIALEPAWQKIYFIGRVLVFIFFLLIVLYFAKNTFFPQEELTFDFKNPKSSKNELGYENISPDEKIIDMYSRKKISAIEFEITTNKNHPDLLNDTVELRRTFIAFAYPTSSQPAIFSDGMLIRNSGNFFLISNEKTRKFSSPKILETLGYSQDNFQEASNEEISCVAKGEDIIETENYPENALFLINGNYYKLIANSLRPFVSEKAFLSNFEKNQALVKDESFLQKYLVDYDNPLGFSNGTLLSFDIGVFLVEEGKVVPFNNPETFLALGYSWDDIIPANEEEIGLYQRDKVFSISRPHPSGTVFFTQDTNKYYLVSGQNKQEIKGENILKTHLKRKPILVKEDDIKFSNACYLKKHLWPFNSYGCKILTTDLIDNFGKDYQFKINSPSISDISAANIITYQEINWPNMRDVLSDIKQRLLGNYGYEETL